MISRQSARESILHLQTFFVSFLWGAKKYMCLLFSQVLIEGVGGSKSSLDQQPQNEASSPGHLVSSSQPDNAAPARSSCLPARTLSRTGDPPPSNPLPLPPKSQKLTLMAPPKRHVRKNPLIIPSGTAVNLLRKEAVTEVDHYDLQVSFCWSKSSEE